MLFRNALVIDVDHVATMARQSQSYYRYRGMPTPREGEYDGIPRRLASYMNLIVLRSQNSEKEPIYKIIKSRYSVPPRDWITEEQMATYMNSEHDV